MEWETLKAGDKILVESTDIYRLKTGERIEMGYNGRFEVIRVDKAGIVCYSSDTGYAFIDMVTEGKTPTGITRSIPNIYLVE